MMEYDADNLLIDNVIKIVITFEQFPDQEITVKDLIVHYCSSVGMYQKFTKCRHNIITGNEVDVRKD